MNTLILSRGWELDSLADKALKAAARFWFAVVLTGQFIFAFSVASFYGMTALRGNLPAWNKVLAQGYVPGDTVGITALAAHLLLAAAVMFAGSLQLIPQIRARYPVFHRWNGRMYVIAAFIMGVTGLYLLSGGKVVGDALQHAAIAINAVLIMICAVMAWRYALARDFRTHRRWALRLFIVVGGVWFFRIGLMFWLSINQGPAGFDSARFVGPFITFLAFAQYLIPLAVLELYLRAQERAGAPARIAMAAGLSILTVAMGVGIVAATMGLWVPKVKAAYDTRTSIADTLVATIASSGIDAAIRQYRELRTAEPAVYNFDESELNNLGYKFIGNKEFKQAIRILQLNAEAYPQSSNVYDSLAEAYFDDGDKTRAIANYRKAVELDPNKRSAAMALEKLDAP
jgi:hypothetical protein